MQVSPTQAFLPTAPCSLRCVIARGHWDHCSGPTKATHSVRKGYSGHAAVSSPPVGVHSAQEVGSREGHTLLVGVASHSWVCLQVNYRRAQAGLSLSPPSAQWFLFLLVYSSDEPLGGGLTDETQPHLHKG